MGGGQRENFPVASLLCPRALRAPVRAIYRFARTADDLADEGTARPEQRRSLLCDYRAALHAAAGGAAASRWPEVFAPLAETIAGHRLPLALLDDLLDAFVQDTFGAGFAGRAELLDYCRRSANPIGRLLLHLQGITDAESLAQSDAICSALQLINFWQDPSVDLPRGRCNLPRDDLRRHGVTPAMLAAGRDTDQTRALLRDLGAWAVELMARGTPLVWRLPGRMGWELRLVVQGGLRVVEKLATLDYGALSTRPALGARDWALMLARAARMRPRRSAADWRPA
jgi:hydroxysqualene synthase